MILSFPFQLEMEAMEEAGRSFSSLPPALGEEDEEGLDENDDPVGRKAGSFDSSHRPPPAAASAAAASHRHLLMQQRGFFLAQQDSRIPTRFSSQQRMVGRQGDMQYHSAKVALYIYCFK